MAKDGAATSGSAPVPRESRVMHLLMIAGFKQQVSTLVRWLLSFLSNGRSERVTTNQQLVGRLAMQQLGSRTSAPLMRGETISPTKAQKPNP